MPQPKNDAEPAEAIKSLVGRLAEDGRFSGSIIWAKDGEALVNGAWGFADQNRGTTNTVGTAFDVASIGKLFTQTAILQLMEQGKLALDDKVGQHLKDYPNKSVAEKVTIRQLLLNTGGLGDIFGRFENGPPPFARMTELKDFLPLFVNEPLLFEPGANNEYSNAGYIVLDPTGHYTRIVLCNEGPSMAMQMAFTIREWFRQIPKLGEEQPASLETPGDNSGKAA